MAVVILMVIRFSLVIKSLFVGGISVAYVMALRAVQGFICVFTVLMEYELLINWRLAAERDTARACLGRAPVPRELSDSGCYQHAHV